MKITKGIYMLLFSGLLLLACKQEKKTEIDSSNESIEVTNSDSEKNSNEDEIESRKEHSKSSHENKTSESPNSESIEHEKVEQTEGIDTKNLEVKEIKVKNKAPKLSIKSVDYPPIYPDCEGTKTQLMTCLNDKIVDFVDRNYNPIVSAEDGITEDNYKVVVQFDINTFGEIVEIQAQGPNKEIETEAIRVINSLPKMKPATHNGKPVSVELTVPILLKVRT